MKGKNIIPCLVGFCFFFFAHSADAQSATTTIHSAQDGYWYSASTWQEGRIPGSNDVVHISHLVRMRGTSATVSGLELSSDGRLRGRSRYYRGKLRVTDYFVNHGAIGGYIQSLAVGGHIENHGLLNMGELVLISGPVSSKGVITIPVALEGDIVLGEDLQVNNRFNSRDHRITTTKQDTQIRLKSLPSYLRIEGEAQIEIQGVVGEEIYLAGISAPESQLSLAAAQAVLDGPLETSKTTISGKVTSSKTGSIIKGDLTITSTGQLRGESVWARHPITFDGNLTNYGTLGPYLRPSITGDLVNLGLYTGQEIFMQGDGARTVIGELPTTIELYGDQEWSTSPHIFSLRSRGHTLTLEEGVELRLTNVVDPLEIVGKGSVQIVDPAGGESYSPNVQAIDAPGALVALEASAARLGDDITAAAVEIREALQVSDDIHIRANQVAFIGGSIRGRGSSRQYRVAVDTPELSGSGHLGPYTDFRMYTDIPQGFSAGWNTGVYLEHQGDGWRGKYRLAGAVADFLEDPLSVLSSSIQPNLREALNSGDPHYYSYETSRGWGDVFSINASANPFDTDSGIASRSFFHIGFLPNQSVRTPFEVVVTTPTDPDFSGTVRLLARRGEVYPQSVKLEDGVWRGEVELFDSGAGQQIIVQGTGAQVARSGRSNYFVTQQGGEAAQGALSGIVRSGAGERVDHGSVHLTNVATLKQYSSSIDSDGSYYGEFPAGTYLVETGRAISQRIDIRAGELAVKDLVLNRACPASNKTPVLLVPGMMGSDRIGNSQIFPSLTKHVPAWDEQILEIHDPGGVTGFGLLADELEQHGYKRGCTLFHAPYDWSLSVVDSAEQYLKPWIQHAKQTASSTQVDIVAHSMGGLVARAYIQGDSYDGDVRKLAMAGTPNLGSAKSYFAWEGGDPLQADSFDNGFLAALVGAKNYQTNTIALNYKIKTANTNNLCTYGLPSIINLFRGNDDVLACDTVAIKAFLHQYAPAAGELYPVYEFLFDKDGDVLNSHFTNTLLSNLNQGESEFASLEEQNVEIGLFVGVVEDTSGVAEEGTVDNIVVDTTSSNSYIYPDGDIEYLTYWRGDGTVLEESVKGIEYDHIEYFNRPHVSIIVSAGEEIIDFLRN